MSRPRRPRAARPAIPLVLWRYLADEIEDEATLTSAERGVLGAARLLNAPDLGEIWCRLASAIVAEFAEQHPGMRPAHWWAVDAPEPRRRVGGVGTPQHERLATGLSLTYGVPRYWISQGLLDTYRGIGTDLGVPAVDPSNPPMFESEGAYLKRHRLFLPGEARRLTRADYEPESLLELVDIR